MILFYSSEIKLPSIVLQDEEYRHCTKVLRKNVHDELMVTDGKGHLFTCTLIKINKDDCDCLVQSTTFQEKPNGKLAVAIAVTKNPSRIEWVIEKLVEIGVSEIHVFISKRTEKKHINVDRLKKIVLSAMKQSLQLYLPDLYFHNDYFKMIENLSPELKARYIAHCDGPTVLLSDIATKDNHQLLLIGPEGDFTTEEIETAKNAGFKEVSLGPSRLRTETAGLVGLVMMKDFSC